MKPKLEPIATGDRVRIATDEERKLEPWENGSPYAGAKGRVLGAASEADGAEPNDDLWWVAFKQDGVTHRMRFEGYELRVIA